MSRRERPDRNPKFASFIDGAFIGSWRQRLLSRRRFLLQAMATTMAAGAGLHAVNLFATTPTKTGKAGKADAVETALGVDWGEHERRTLAAVQNQLFPAGDGSAGDSGPGADDINALAYLLKALDDPALADDRHFIRNGIGWLDDLSASTFEKKFLQLDAGGREQLLGTIANSSAGENWLSTLLLYIFEALLTDPVYGGNPGGIGWQWLEHAPGFPRPPTGKVYSKLG